MPDTLNINSKLSIKINFKWEKNKHLINISFDKMNTVLFPRPYLRADVVNDLNVSFFQLFCQSKIKAGVINENYGVNIY